MLLIQIYDPPMCCSTGICGTDIDPSLVGFASLLKPLTSAGVKVERDNLDHQPMAFAENASVKDLLDTEGMQALPLMFWDGAVQRRGRYPTDTERADWLRAAAMECLGENDARRGHRSADPVQSSTRNGMRLPFPIHASPYVLAPAAIVGAPVPGCDDPAAATLKAASALLPTCVGRHAAYRREIVNASTWEGPTQRL